MAKCWRRAASRQNVLLHSSNPDALSRLAHGVARDTLSRVPPAPHHPHQRVGNAAWKEEDDDDEQNSERQAAPNGPSRREFIKAHENECTQDWSKKMPRTTQHNRQNHLSGENPVKLLRSNLARQLAVQASGKAYKKSG